jgi:hypothetical protein
LSIVQYLLLMVKLVLSLHHQMLFALNWTKSNSDFKHIFLWIINRQIVAENIVWQEWR